MRTLVRLVATVAGAALIAPALLTASPAPSHAAQDAVDIIEDKLFNAHQQARKDPGAFGHGSETPQDVFELADDVTQVARAWSEEMAATGVFKHNPEFFTETCCWSFIGENIAFAGPMGAFGGPAGVSETMMQGWMDSEGHRNNIMNGQFDQVGIGVAISDDERVYATAVFREATSDAPSGDTDKKDEPKDEPKGEPKDEPKEDEPKDDEDKGEPKDDVTLPKVRGTKHSCPDSKVPATSLKDLDTASQKDAVNCLAWWDVTQGTSDTTYHPYRTVTRGEMSSFMVRAIEQAGGELPSGEAGTFPDVPDSHTHAQNIERLVAAGIVNGYVDGTFRPDEPVLRRHMAVFLVDSFEYRSGKALPDPSTEWFSDAPDGSMGAYVQKLGEVGWSGGYGDGTFGPADDVRRDHMAYFITRWLDQMVEQDFAQLP